MAGPHCNCRHLYEARGGEPVRGSGSLDDPYLHERPRTTCLVTADNPTVPLPINAADACVALPSYVESVVIDQPTNTFELRVNDNDQLIIRQTPMTGFGFVGAGHLGTAVGGRTPLVYTDGSVYQLTLTSVGGSFSNVPLQLRQGRKERNDQLQDFIYASPQPSTTGDGTISMPQLYREATFQNDALVTVPLYPGSEVVVMPTENFPVRLNRSTKMLVTVTISVSTTAAPVLGSGGVVYTGEYEDIYTPDYTQPGSGTDTGGLLLTEDGLELTQENGHLLYQEDTPYYYPPLSSHIFWNFILLRNNTHRVGFGSQSIASLSLNETWYTFYDLVEIETDGISSPEIDYRIKTDKIQIGYNDAYSFSVNWSKVHFQFI